MILNIMFIRIFINNLLSIYLSIYLSCLCIYDLMVAGPVRSVSYRSESYRSESYICEVKVRCSRSTWRIVVGGCGVP
jgi:hypothetical protein